MKAATEKREKDDWKTLVSVFPKDWKKLGAEAGATNYMRGFSSPEVLLRVLLLHIGKGYSLKETATRARISKLAKVSGVALFKRLKKSEEWLKNLCLALLAEKGIDIKRLNPSIQFRVVDGSIVKEPGKTGSQWRFLFSFRLPDLECDQFDLTPSDGKGTGEHLSRLKVKKGDHILGDRAYANTEGVIYVLKHGGQVLVRSNGVMLPMYDEDGKQISLLKRLSAITEAGTIMEWPVWIGEGKQRYAGRLCVLRKSDIQIEQTLKKLRQVAYKNQRKLKPATLKYAKFVMVFTTFSPDKFSSRDVMECYRLRWQIELAIKRLKSIIELGHVPKGDEISCKAWLYGKLFVGLLTEKLLHIGRSFSPWGYHLQRSQIQ
jgi:hypothetical protein